MNIGKRRRMRDGKEGKGDRLGRIEEDCKEKNRTEDE
jgi:hypothetical protein